MCLSMTVFLLTLKQSSCGRLRLLHPAYPLPRAAPVRVWFAPLAYPYNPAIDNLGSSNYGYDNGETFGGLIGEHCMLCFLHAGTHIRYSTSSFPPLHPMLRREVTQRVDRQ